MKPRISKPEAGNKYYISIRNGGYNGADGNPLRLNKELTSLPNCVAIYGWLNEQGENGAQYLKAPWYPYAVISAAKREGLTVTKEPTLGGILVWTGGKHNLGHVEGVGRLYSDDELLGVGSEYYGRDWATFRRKRGDGNWREGCYWMDSSYVYQGCIKSPFMEDDEMLSYEQFKEYMKKYEDERAKEPAVSWAVPHIEWANKNGIIVGDDDGEFRPKDPISREEMAGVARSIMIAVSRLFDKFAK